MIYNASNLNPNLATIGGFELRWYAIAYIIGFLLGLKYCIFLIRKDKELFKVDMNDLLTWVIVGVLLGGRLAYVFFYNWSYFSEHLADIVKIWQGGMSFHGGALGAVVGIILFARKRKLNILKLTDVTAAAAPIGLFFGRIANFVNNELWGRATNGSWGVIFNDGKGIPRHPSQLYEAFLEGLVLFIILNICYRKFGDKRGFVTGIAMVLYAVFRTILEFFREPDAQLGFIAEQFTMGQILSLPMIIIGAGLIVNSLRRK